jgi:hypothetical protein
VAGAPIFFGDEAHFRADADRRGKWVLRGQPARVDSTSPRLGEKATSDSAVCLETGEGEEREPEGNCTAATAAAFLRQLRANHPAPLIVIWDNGPAHRVEPIRNLLATPDVNLHLVSLPGYRPDFNADEARPISYRGAASPKPTTWQYHHRASGPSARRASAAGCAPVSGERRAALGHRAAGWQPTVCSRFVVCAARDLGDPLPARRSAGETGIIATPNVAPQSGRAPRPRHARAPPAGARAGARSGARG